jgi:hypothetical protein
VGDLFDLMLLLVFGRIALHDAAASGKVLRNISSESTLPDAKNRPRFWLEGLEDCENSFNC